MMHRPHLNLILALAMLALSCTPSAAVPTAQPAAAQQPTETAVTAATARAPEAATAVPPTAVAPTATASSTTPTALPLTMTAAPAAGAGPVIAAGRPADAARQVERIEFSGLAAKRHVDVLAQEIGSRPAGSASQARAAEYVRDQLSTLGYQTDLQPFTISSFEDRGSSLTVGGRALQANALNHSGAGQVEGELVDVGLARTTDFSPGAVRGKIALIRRGEIRFAEKVENVERAGAIGAVIYNNQPSNFNGSLAGPVQIPAISVALGDGTDLLTALQGEPVTARLAVDAGVEERTAANVVATKPGGPRTIYIGGHFDSVPAGPGANDNASGTAVMLELARALAWRPSAFTLKFVAFDAEEVGLLGSSHLVSQLSEEERRSIRAMINLDMVGVGDQPMFGGSDELTRVAFPLAAALGQPARQLGDGLNGASDHASFLRADVPAVFFYRADDPNYHSPNDRAEFVDPSNLDFAGRVALGLLDALDSGR